MNTFFSKKISEYILKGTLICVLSLLIIFTGCSKKTSTKQSEIKSEEDIIEEPIEEPIIEEKPKWYPTDKRIVIMFGYGYNDASFVESTTAILAEEFGLESENGLIKVLVFPDNFKIGDAERISMLPDLIADVNICGLLLIGSPERAHASLARFQDNNRTWPVFSLFSQDDILGTEAGSDLVLDYSPVKSNDTELVEEAVIELSSDLPELLVSTVKAMQTVKTVPVSSPELKVLVQSIAGTTWRIANYVDPETGLTSINHYIIEK